MGDLVWPLGQIAYGRGALEAVHGLIGAGHDGQAHVLGRRGRKRRRPAEEIALAEMRAQSDEAGQLGFGLDAFGHDAQPIFSAKASMVSKSARLTGLASMPRTRDMSIFMKSGLISAMEARPE